MLKRIAGSVSSIKVSPVSREKQQKVVNMGSIFFSPYLRIIPMHLMILGPAFLGWSHVSIFLWLKTITDLLMHIFINRSQQPAVAIS